MSFVSKPSCTHGIIIPLWLVCYIQCEFSFSYLSILGIAAHIRSRSSRPEMFLGKALLKMCSKFTGELSNFIDMTIRHGCSSVNCCKFSEHSFLKTRLDGCFCRFDISPIFTFLFEF